MRQASTLVVHTNDCPSVLLGRSRGRQFVLQLNIVRPHYGRLKAVDSHSSFAALHG